MNSVCNSVRHYFQKVIFFFSVFVIGFVCISQEKQGDVNVNIKKDNFWGQPGIWVAGAAVFIVLLVAILRGGRKSV